MLSQSQENRQDLFIPSGNTVYPKSNVLISGKYKSTLLENQIMAYSLAHAAQFDLGQTDRETIKSSFSVKELKQIVGGNGGSFYTRLNATAQAMTGRSIGMSSEDGKTFDYIAVVTRATCANGVFTIEYNGAVRNLLVDLQRNYSKLNLAIQMRFKNNYAFRLYELLKQKCFHAKGDTTSKENVYMVRMGLAELKLELGIVNAELDSVKKVLKNKKNPDFEKALEVSPERMFDNWYDFRRSVLEKALKEINEQSDIFVEYTPIRQGTGGKVVGIDFTIQQSAIDKDAVMNMILTEDDKLDMLVDLREMTKREFTTKELRTIADAAKWEKEKIEQAYQIYMTQTDVKNPVGWMVKAIKEGYKEGNKKTGAKRNTKKNAKMNNFDQREYDYDELERALSKASKEN